MPKYENSEFWISGAWDKYKLSLCLNPSFDEKVLADALVEYEDSKRRYPAPSRLFPKIRYRLVPFLKWALIPVLAIAVILVLNPFEGSSVAWGKVIKRVDEAPTTIIRGETFLRGEDKELRPFLTKSLGYFSKEFGGYFEVTSLGTITVRCFNSPDRKLFTVIDPRTNKPIQVTTAAGPGLWADPKILINSFLSHPYIKIGKLMINGIEAEGIESQSDSTEEGSNLYQVKKRIRRLWVAIKTGLPIRQESSSFTPIGEIVNIYDFEWNKPLPKSLFQIPNVDKAPDKK